MKIGDKLPEERNILTIGMYGNVDYLDLKGIVENVLDTLGIKNASLKEKVKTTTYHPGKTANLYIGKNSVRYYWRNSSRCKWNYGIEEDCYIAELNLDKLYNCRLK